MSIFKRYLLFALGIFSMAFGISLVIKSLLGTSPISSIPYILSLKYPLSIGGFTFIVNMAFLLGQILLLRRQFQYIQLLQIPITIVFSFFIDMTMSLLNGLAPEFYSSRFLTVLLGTTFLAFGVSLQIIANVVTLAGEGLVNAIASCWQFDFGRTKTVFDTALVLIAGLLSWLYFGEFRGIREGTFISALLTGSIARFCIKNLSCIDAGGQITLKPFRHSKAKEPAAAVKSAREK